jgi:hypothetical protein
MSHNRLTPRQGLIHDASRMLVQRFGVCSLENYRQNVWSVMHDCSAFYPSRIKYLADMRPGSLAAIRLYNAIAREAYQHMLSTTPPAMRGMKFHRVCEGDPGYWK